MLDFLLTKNGTPMLTVTFKLQLSWQNIGFSVPQKFQKLVDLIFEVLSLFKFILIDHQNLTSVVLLSKNYDNDDEDPHDPHHQSSSKLSVFQNFHQKQHTARPQVDAGHQLPAGPHASVEVDVIKAEFQMDDHWSNQ